MSLPLLVEAVPSLIESQRDLNLHHDRVVLAARSHLISGAVQNRLLDVTLTNLLAGVEDDMMASIWHDVDSTDPICLMKRSRESSSRGPESAEALI